MNIVHIKNIIKFIPIRLIDLFHLQICVLKRDVLVSELQAKIDPINDVNKVLCAKLHNKYEVINMSINQNSVNNFYPQALERRVLIKIIISHNVLFQCVASFRYNK